MKKAWRIRLLGVDALIVVIALAGAHQFEKEDLDHSIEDIRQNMLESGTVLAGKISTELTERQMVGVSVATALGQYPGMTDSQYASFAGALRADMTDIRNIAVVEDLVITRIHPVIGNEPVLGADFRTYPVMRPGIIEALREKRTIVVGPLELIQGGQGFILRTPVTGGRGDAIVSVVVDSEALFRNIDPMAGFGDYDIALRRQGKALGSPKEIWGNPAIFERDAVTVPFEVETETWELGMVPVAAWPTQGSSFVIIHAMATFFALFAVVTNHVLHHFRRKGEEARQQLADAVETIDGGFALFDAEDRLVMCNSKYRHIYRRSADVIQPGRPFRDILKSGLENGQYPDAVGREAEWLEERLAIHLRADQIIEQQLDDGSWLRVSESKTSDGGTVGFRVDITDLKHAREAAEAANRATSEFLSTINHEIRTPLASVIGFVAFLASSNKLSSHKALLQALNAPDSTKDEVGVLLNAYLDETGLFAQRAQASAKHLLELVNDTLDLAKIQNGGLTLSPEKMDICPLIHESMLQFSTLASQKGLNLIYDCSPTMVWVDKVRFRQIMINLIGNAVKFTEKGHVRISSHCEGDRVRISVEDTGPGIGPKHRERVFDRFWQADGSVTRRHSGTGLGLAITRELVELHGGKIEVDTTEGKGSRFSIVIPTTTGTTELPIPAKQVA